MYIMYIMYICTYVYVHAMYNNIVINFQFVIDHLIDLLQFVFILDE